MPQSDSDLLFSYLKIDNEAAFGKLVSRYLPLVRGVIYRRTGQADLVDDLAMQVFATLAQKAPSLKNRASLAGWLVLTARLKTADALRKNAIRKKYMDQYTIEEDVPVDQPIPPELDDALASLSTIDREAILLRFYEKMSYRDVGQRLGVREEAMRKRIRRALDQMSLFLKRRDVSFSPAILTTGLTSVNVPPMKAAEEISKGALSFTLTPAASLSFGKLLVLGFAVLIIPGSLGFLVGSKQPASPYEPSRISSKPPQEHRVPESTKKTIEEVMEKHLTKSLSARIHLAAGMWDLIRINPLSEVGEEYNRLMKSFRPDECAEALAILDRDLTYNYDRHWRMSGPLVWIMANDDPKGTLDYAMEQIEAGNEHWKRHDRLGCALERWANLSPADAQKWLADQTFSVTQRREYFNHLIEGVSKRAPGEALAIIQNFADPERHLALDSWRRLGNPDLRQALVESTATIVDEGERAKVFRQIVLLQERNLGDLVSSYQQMQFSRSDEVVPVLNDILSRAIRGDYSIASDVLDVAFQDAPLSARPHFLDRYVKKWLENDPVEAKQWLSRHELTPSDVELAVSTFRRP